MKEEVIIKSLHIEKIGEKQFFQISLPHDTKRIIGIEYGTTAKDGVPLPSPFFAIGGDQDPSLWLEASKIIGRLVLRTAGCTGIFYQDDLVEDKNIHFGENIAPVLWTPFQWTHGRKRHETKISVGENRLIHGFYQDSWGIGEFETLSYNLNIYLWIEKCMK